MFHDVVELVAWAWWRPVLLGLEWEESVLVGGCTREELVEEEEEGGRE